MAEKLCEIRKKGNSGINLKGFTFSFEMLTNQSGNNRAYCFLPIDNINSFKVTSMTGTAQYKRFGWKGIDSASTDIVVDTVYTKPSDATQLAIFILAQNNASSPAVITIQIID